MLLYGPAAVHTSYYPYCRSITSLNPQNVGEGVTLSIIPSNSIQSVRTLYKTEREINHGRMYGTGCEYVG